MAPDVLCHPSSSPCFALIRDIVGPAPQLQRAFVWQLLDAPRPSRVDTTAMPTDQGVLRNRGQTYEQFRYATLGTIP